MNISKPVRFIYLRPPLKYASSWLVFLNIMKWNRFRRFSDICRLLELSDEGSKGTDRWWDGSQVPYAYVEEACGLECNELQYAFLDGWFPRLSISGCGSLDIGSQPRIRHCAQCIKLGYHSAVFYFEYITHCPWHQEPLRYCQHCTNVLSKSWRGRHRIAEAAENCEHLAIILDAIPAKEISVNLRFEVNNWCAGFRLCIKCGWQLIRENIHEIFAGKPSKLQDKKVPTQLLAERLSHNFLAVATGVPVTFFKLPFAEITRRLRNLLKPDDLLVSELLKSKDPLVKFEDYVLVEKSIRRYIFRRYIRFHRKCLARLVKLDPDSWYQLNLENVCPCVTAYLTTFARRWAVSPYELLKARESLLDSHFIDFSQDGEILDCVRTCELYKLIARFYRTWSLLRHYREIDGGKFVLNYRHDGSLLSFAVPMIYETAHKGSDGAYRDAVMLMEEPGRVLQKSVVYCASRLNKPLKVEIGLYSTWLLSNNKNMICALHNRAVSDHRRLDI